MLTSLLTQGRVIAAPLAITLQNVQTWLDHMLVPAEGMPPDGMPAEAKKGGFPTWVIFVIAIPLLICLVAFCIIVVLTLLGPAIGNVFSNITDSI